LFFSTHLYLLLTRTYSKSAFSLSAEFMLLQVDSIL
jgi:hypothetical protein